MHCEGILTDYLGTIDRRPHTESSGADVLCPSVLMEGRRLHGVRITAGKGKLLFFI